MDILTALGLSVPAGLNAYIPLLAVALSQRFHWLELRPPFDVLGSWWLITIIAVLLVVEVVADKIPAVDHVNDIIQSVVRPAAGAVVAVAASGSASSVSPWLLVVAGVLLAGGVHAVKATARPVVQHCHRRGGGTGGERRGRCGGGGALGAGNRDSCSCLRRGLDLGCSAVEVVAAEADRPSPAKSLSGLHLVPGSGARHPGSPKNPTTRHGWCHSESVEATPRQGGGGMKLSGTRWWRTRGLADICTR